MSVNESVDLKIVL